MSETASLRQSLPLSVCHLVSGDLWAGAEVQVYNLLKELHRNKDLLRLCVVVLNRGELSDRLRKTNIETIVLDENNLSFWQLIFKLRQILKSEKFDAVHSHRYKENIVVVLASRYLPNAPLLLQTIHGLPHYQKGINGFKMFCYATIDNILRFFFADGCVAVSKDLYAALTKRKSSNNFYCIPNGVDLKHSVVANKEQSRKITIAVVGRLTSVKNFQYFLRSIPKMLGLRDDLNFLVIGDGPERSALELLSRQLCIEEFVEFTGHIEDMSWMWPKIDIYVLCSRHEGLSMALLEALSHGVFVVATAVGGNTEVIQHGGNGLLIPVDSYEAIAEACLSLLQASTDQSEAMKKAAVKTIEQKFSIEHCAERYFQLYQSILCRVSE